MKKLSLLILISCAACTSGIQSSVDQMKGQMDQLNDKVGKMARSAEQTADTSKTMADRDPTGDLKFSEAFAQILDDRNFQYLIPFPVEILPYATTIASDGEIEQILGIVKAWYESIWTADLDTAYENKKDRASQVEADKFKLSRIQAIKGVCGAIPADKWDKLVTDEYLQPGEFNEVAEICLWARAAFIKGELLSEPNYNGVILEKSVEKLTGLEKLFDVVGKNLIAVDLHTSFYQASFQDYMNSENPVKAQDVLHIWDVLAEAPEIILKRNPGVDETKLLELKQLIGAGKAAATETLMLN